MLFQNYARHDRVLRQSSILCFVLFCYNIFTFSARVIARLYKAREKKVWKQIFLFDYPTNTHNVAQVKYPRFSTKELLITGSVSTIFVCFYCLCAPQHKSTAEQTAGFGSTSSSMPRFGISVLAVSPGSGPRLFFLTCLC